MSGLSDALRRIGTQVAALLGRPTIDGLYLPAPVEDETFRDEFGFVFLTDGSVGPFYVSMGDLLRRLWQRHPEPDGLRADPTDLLQGLAGGDLADRALALGAYNALSAALFRATGFTPPERATGGGLNGLPPGTRVGMIGYFGPLVERLEAQGCRLSVLELAPERVAEGPNVALCRDAAALAGCDLVLCTASTLVNDSLEGLLAALGPHPRVELIGPSGSGLPDPLFARGIDAIGGVAFAGKVPLLAQLRRGEPWGSAGRKYQLERTGYPGLAGLVARLTDRGVEPDQP